MTPTFDYAAFLDSPNVVNDGPQGANVFSGPPLLTHSLSNDLLDTLSASKTPFGGLDEPSIIPEWASSTLLGPAISAYDFASTTDAIPHRGMASDTQMTDVNKEAITTSKNVNASNYRSIIANHHISQLRHCIPQLGGAAGGASAGLGGAGQRSLGGSHSSPSVPLSQAARAQNGKRASELTIQERRRLSRRAQATGTGHAQSFSSNLAKNTKSIMNAPTINKSAVTPIYDTQFSNNESQFAKRAYSFSGFDLIGALSRVAQRPNPKIEIGPVDLSCSFTVSDAQHPDQPIVHCSDTFCNLTGYSREEIIGRNCRFLQSPDGKIVKGSERVHTDNGAVKHIRQHCAKLQECQTSLINYRKDGSPFINLVTIVPITWGDSTEPVFLVGFQVDLVEQPGAVLERMPNGLYVVNYSSSAHNGPPSFAALKDPHFAEAGDVVIKDPAEEESNKQAMMAQELAELIGNGSEETAKWARVLLDNSHDLVHVLSLKGTFLYVSPSVERLLGYTADELVGKSISEFCHPSDVVPVFRELKDSTSNSSIAAAARHWARVDGTVNPPTKGGAGQTGPQVNLIMRMRHKERGYEWIENVGKLHLEQGKGRKVVISTGRARPVYNLPWEQAKRSLEHSGPGFWSKLSQSGLILSTSGSISEVFDGDSSPPQVNGTAQSSLAGMHIGDVVRVEAKNAILTALQSSDVTGIPHQMSKDYASSSTIVMSTIIPSSAGGQGLPIVFMHTQKVSMADLGSLQLNQIHTRDANLVRVEANRAAMLEKGEPEGNSVFGELSTHRSSSWVFELHQLKIANKKLREEIRAHQRRISGGGPVISVPPPSPSKTKTPIRQNSNSTSKAFLEAPNESSGSGNSSSESRTISPYHYSNSSTNSGSGSSSDTTVATSVVMSGTDNPVASGMKRSRS